MHWTVTGLRKVSSQKKHLKKGRFRHRIKEFLGFKTKEKRNPQDEPWVIVDSSLKSHESYSVSELGTDEENNSRSARAASEPIKNIPDETYENFNFQSDQQPLRTVETKPQKSFEVTKVEETVHFLDIKECDRSNVLQANVSNRNLEVSGDICKDIDIFEFDQPCLSSLKSSEKRFKFKNLPNETNEYRLDDEPLWVMQEPNVLEKSATEVLFSENDGLTETLKDLPSNDMVEVCNATIMIEDEDLVSEELHSPLITVKDRHGKDDARSPNPDYEPIEVNSSSIVYPPYNSTLNYFFPRRLEVISEESSDLSENNEEKKEKKPWENSELIRRANDVSCIPNDWYGSDDGIDTSWRDGKSIEEVSDIAIVSDSHSDSDLVSEELRVNKAVVTENEAIKYNVSKSNPKRNQICNLKKIEGKPPANSEIKKLPKTEGLRSHLENGNGLTKSQATLISTLENMNKESLTKSQPHESDQDRSKVTCRVIESPTNCRKENSKGSQPSPSCERKFVKEKSKSPEIKRQVLALKQTPDVQGATKVSCTIIKQEEITFQSGKANVVDCSPRVSKKNIYPSDTSKCDGAQNLTIDLKHDKNVLKNTNIDKNEDIKFNKSKPKVPISESNKTTLAPFQICQRSNQENFLSESNKSCQKIEFAKKEADKKRGVQLSTNTVNPLTISEIELVYIDSSDSDAISNRRSISLEKEEEAILEDKKNEVLQLNDRNKPMKFEEDRNQIIKKEITNINQSVKEISSVCSESSTSYVKFLNKPPNIDIFQFAPFEYPNLLSPIFSRKNSSKKIDKKRRFSYPIAEQDLVKAFSDSCLRCTSLKAAESLCKHHDSNNNQRGSKSDKTSTNILTNPFKEPEFNRKIYTLRSLPSTPPANSDWVTLSNNQTESLDSILLEFSDESVSSESYTLPEDKNSEKLSDESSDTIKYFRIPDHSPKSAQSPPEVSDIVDLHKKFIERRGYHEVSPLMKKKTEVKQKIPEPDLIALSKCCKEQNEQAYTPELLAEAANLLALHRYHESRQRKMCQGYNINKDVKNKIPPPSVQPEKIKTTPNNIKTVKDDVIKECMAASSSEKGMNEPIAEYKCIYKSDCPENETVGKSRLLELFQKLGSKSSSTDSSLPEPFPYCIVLEDVHITEDVCEHQGDCQCDLRHGKIFIESPPQTSAKEELKNEDKATSKESTAKDESVIFSVIKASELPPGEIFQRKMYEEYLGKMAELAERRNMKIIKISNVPGSSNGPSENAPQPLESEFMIKVKERNEKLGIIIDQEEEEIVSAECKTERIQDLPKHLKELMEITEECGDILGNGGLLAEIDEALSPERKGFLTLKGIWSPATTPETERKKFDFTNDIKALKEEREREKRKEEEERKEPQPAVWTPRSAGPSPTPERKFRPVNFQSPPPTRKEIKITNETPELPKDLPLTPDKDSKSRLTTSSSENSPLSSSLRLPTAQNPTITLLQKAREGQIPRGAQYLEEHPCIGPNEILYSVKKEYVNEDHSKKVVDLGPRKIEGIGPTTKEGVPIVLRSEVKEDNQQKWYKRMYDSLHKADHDKDFVTVKYKTRRGNYPYSSYAGGYSSEPERLGYDSDVPHFKYATLDRRKIRNKENDFTSSTMPRNRYAHGVKYAVDVYKNQPGRIEDYEPGHSSIADKETKQWWDEVMDIFDGELNDSKTNYSKYSGKPYSYSFKDTGYESDSTLVFKRRENNMSDLSPNEQKMAYKVIQKGGEVPLQGLRKSVPDRPKEDSEIEYFPLSPTLTRIRVHKKTPRPKEKVFYPVSDDFGCPTKRTTRSVRPMPPRRESSRYNSTLKMYAHVGMTSSEMYRDRFVSPVPRTENINVKIEKTREKIKNPKIDKPTSQTLIACPKRDALRKSPDLKAPGEVKKVIKESKVPSNTVVKSSTTLYSSARNKKPKEDKALKVTVAISTKGKEILSPSSVSSKSDYRKSPIPVKFEPKEKVNSPPILKNSRPSSRSSVVSTSLTEPKKMKREVVDIKKKKDKKLEIKIVEKTKDEEKKKAKKKQENGKKKNGSKKKDKENIPLEISTNSEIALEESPKKKDFFQKLLLRESNSPCPSISSSTVSRTQSILEKVKKFSDQPKSCFKSEPSLRNLNVYLSQKRPVSESRFRSLERKYSTRALSPFYGTYDFYDKLDKFDSHNNVWDSSLCYQFECVKSRSSSEPPRTSPTYDPDTSDNATSTSPSTSRSPSCRRLKRPTSRAVETISGVKRKFRSKSLNETDRHSHVGSTSSLSLSQFTDHDEYKTYFFELLHQTKKSDKFKELHKFYSSLERMAELEKTTSNTDLRPRLKGEEVIDFDRWKQLRNKEKAEKELLSLKEKLKDDQKEKGFLFQPREPVRWSGDSGLRHKEKSVEDLRVQYQKLVERSQSERKSEMGSSKDVYKPLWRGNSVANLANSLTSITGSKRGRPIIESSAPLPISKQPVRRDKEIGSRLWSSLSMEQVNALKNQLSEIYSTVSSLKQERIKKIKQNIQDYEVNVVDLRGDSPLHVRSNSLVGTNQLYSPAVKKKVAHRQECMKADSISTLPSWKSKPLSESEKRTLSMSLSAEVKERIKRKKHGTLVIPRETLGAVAAIKGSKKHKSPCYSESSPRTCYSLLSDESIDKAEDKNKDFILVLTPKERADENENDMKKLVDDWGTKEYAKMVQTTSSSSSSASTVIHLGSKDDVKISPLTRTSGLSQSKSDLRSDFENYKPERKTLYSSQSFSDLKELFGEKHCTPYATLPLRNIKKPCFSSSDSLYKSISPDPMKYYRAYLNVVKAGDVRKLKEKFESYDDLYNLRKDQSPVCKMYRSDPDLTRDYLSRKGGESSKVVVKRQEEGDVQWLRRKYEPRKVSPVPFRVEDRFMPHINVISKTATLQRRSQTPPSRTEVSRTGNVERLKNQFEKHGMSLLGQMFTSTPEMRELRDIAPYLECEWVAHQNPSRCESRRRMRPRPSSASPVRHSAGILKQTDIFANQEFNPEIHRPLYRYQPEPWPARPSWPKPSVTFKEPLGNPIPTPPRDQSSRQRSQESPHRYVESEVNIHYKSPVRREAKAAWPEDELALRQAEIMRRIYQEQKRTKYLNELHDMYSRRHADNLLPSQKSPIPLNRYDDFPLEVQPPRPRDRTPEPKLVARALYNFVGQTSRELSFKRGDIIFVRRQIDKNWYEGEHNAMIGLFPFNYVEIIPYDGIRTLPKKSYEGQARAKFNFQAQSHLELSLVKGELVLLTRRVDENWFEGRIGNRKGIFPVSYVEVLVEPGERVVSPSGSTPTKPIVAPASHSVMLNGAKDIGQQHYQPPRPTIYSSSSLPPSNRSSDISLVNQTLHIETQSDPVPYRVMYNYRPQNEDELELKEGDIVYVMEKCDDGWYVGSLHRNGQFGTFPGNYVERIQ